MQRSTLTSRFLAGFTPMRLPPRGPDGMILPEVDHLPVIDPPSLCEAGPCRNYHRLVTIMDAQDPVGERGPTRRMITRACYPTPGIEVELGEVPVLQCTLWNPEVTEGATQSINGVIVDRAPGNDRDRARSRFLSSDAGRAFTTQVAIFEAAAGLGDDDPADEGVEAAAPDDSFANSNGAYDDDNFDPNAEDLEKLARPEPIKEGGQP